MEDFRHEGSFPSVGFLLSGGNAPFVREATISGAAGVAGAADMAAANASSGQHEQLVAPAAYEERNSSITSPNVVTGSTSPTSASDTTQW